MRQSINLVGCGDFNGCFSNLRFLHDLNEGFSRVSCVGGNTKDMNVKIRVLKQSLQKVYEYETHFGNALKLWHCGLNKYQIFMVLCSPKS